ncbi:serine endoprotease DegQ [Aliidiomarina minuta]|uniref:Serine endoprotease DegQ n=1 Tax=Aliidiomarina minuta TaxID=880057 RepID=A0A432W916_9GAMM|nr:Do family serine endopeptidase [Aliidiomarina minuta]RUO26643.1 serine endoprotease DegQ [Aliidiomarina minuta]
MNKLMLLFLAAGICLTVISGPVHAQIPFSTSSGETPTLAPMLEEVTPAVVNISVQGTRATQQRIPDAFRFFFGPNAPREEAREQPFQGLGSGVIIDADAGYVVTNNHVISDATEITVTLKDGRQFNAEVLGRDEQSDIALLKIENGSNLTAISMGDSDAMRVGDFVVAIGNPFGLGQTVTSGIVSALGRGGFGIDRLENFIQTDAAINRGNSGGALVDLKGNLIGINTAILGSHGGNIGIGFAIPSNMMNNLVEQILEHGEVRRGVLGVRGGDLTQELASALEISRTRGAWVSEVLPESAAEKAGIEAGDVIISMQGRSLNSFAELAARVGSMGAGRTISLGVLRDGEEINIDVELLERDTQVTASLVHPALQGAQLSSADNQQGVRITAVESNTPAERIGLQEDDLIIAVNRQRVTSLGELRRMLDDTSGVVALHVRRGNSTLYLVLPG